MTATRPKSPRLMHAEDAYTVFVCTSSDETSGDAKTVGRGTTLRSITKSFEVRGDTIAKTT